MPGPRPRPSWRSTERNASPNRGARTFANFGYVCLDVAEVTIGENTVVGAGSIVTKDLPANVVAVGNPARVVREI